MILLHDGRGRASLFPRLRHEKSRPTLPLERVKAEDRTECGAEKTRSRRSGMTDQAATWSRRRLAFTSTSSRASWRGSDLATAVMPCTKSNTEAGRVALLDQHGVDHLGGVALREAAPAQKLDPVVVGARHDLLAGRPNAGDEAGRGPAPLPLRQPRSPPALLPTNARPTAAPGTTPEPTAAPPCRGAASGPTRRARRPAPLPGRPTTLHARRTGLGEGLARPGALQGCGWASLRPRHDSTRPCCRRGGG